MVDASTITKELLAGKLQEAADVETNVATGYHAIEFLLWGQDLNGTGPAPATVPGPTMRRATPARTATATGARAYLAAATELLVDDLAEMVADWEQDGAARTELAAKGRRRPAWQRS